MNLRDLEYIILVDKYKHFGRAALNGNISQPALSMQIKKLEESLHLKIFERNNKQIITTEKGKQIIEIAQNIIRETEKIKNIAQNQNPLEGDIKIGSFPTLGPYYFPKIIKNLRKNFPKLNIFLIEEKTANLVNKLINCEIDACFLAAPINEESLEFVPLFKDEFYLATPKTHKLAKSKKINQNTLQNEKLLLLEEGHCLRDQALDLCQTIGAKENITFRGSSLETLRQMVIADMGITLIPETAIDKNKDIKYLKFSSPTPSRTIGLAYRKSSNKLDTIKQILNLLEKLTD